MAGQNRAGCQKPGISEWLCPEVCFSHTQIRECLKKAVGVLGTPWTSLVFILECDSEDGHGVEVSLESRGSHGSVSVLKLERDKAIQQGGKS